MHLILKKVLIYQLILAVDQVQQSYQDMQHQASKFSTQQCKAFVEEEFTKSALPSLIDYIKIENVSKGFLTPEDWKATGWAKGVEAANHINNWIKNAGVKGLTSEIISNFEENLTPIIYVEIQGDLDETYFFYGHFDKQPPFEGWNEGLGAYKPVLLPEENPIKLYGRGGADDGYSSYGSILAIKALQAQGIPIPRCVLIFQGDEETSSGDVEKHIEILKEKIGQPKLVFCLDSGAVDYQRLWVTTSLRGFAVATVRVDVLKEGVHSGSASGIIPSSFRILRSLIERLENHETGSVKALDVDIPANRYKELSDLATEVGEPSVQEFMRVGNLQRVSSDVLESLILNGWRAQLAVTGMDGLPKPVTAGNVMLPFTEAKISIRLPPTKNGEEAVKYVVKTLTENPPYNAQVTVTKAYSGQGFNAPEYHPLLSEALESASQEYFGKKPLAISEGGSIPFLTFLNGLWPKAQFIVTGVLGPLSNAHGPNEFLHIPYVKSLICSMAHVLAHTAGRL